MHPYNRVDVALYSRLLAASFQHWVKRPLLAGAAVDSGDFAEALYYAPFILVSHDTQADPVFRYVNHAAQALWRSDFESMTRMPSRLTARPDAQEDRARLLREARKKGYVDNYRGVRTTTDGKLFAISDTILWNVYDEAGMLHGQAACFTNFEWIER